MANAYIQGLKDENGNTILPRTKSSAVHDDKTGKSLNVIVQDMLTVDISGMSGEETTVPVNADTLGGKPESELSVKNSTMLDGHPASDFPTREEVEAKTVDIDDVVEMINTRIDQIGSADMNKSTYDKDDNGIVDNAERLGGQLPEYYATAADYVKKSGDTMADRLVIEKSSYPSVRLDDTSTGSDVAVQNYGQAAVIDVFNTKNDQSKRRSFGVRSSDATTADLKNAVYLRDVNDSTDKVYDIYGEHNVEASMEELSYVKGVTSGIQAQLNNKFPKLGVNPLTTIVGTSATDTVANWVTVGTGCGVLGATDRALITNCPVSGNTAWIFNLVYDNSAIYQLYMPYGKNSTLYHRGGNLEVSWYNNGQWSTIYDSNTVVPIENGGTGATTVAGILSNLGIEAGANNYTHPTHTAKSSGLYKITVDNKGHVSAATAVAKSDITGLGIPAQDTTYSAAGSSLGLVKSGGDVTISSGVITVNDDSHNHTIANVDGLQTALDAKVNANGSIPMTDRLTINRTTYPGVTLNETTVGSRGIIQNYGHSVVLDMFNVAGDDTNRRSLLLRDNSVDTLATAIRLRDKNSTEDKYYDIYGEHNIEASMTELGYVKGVKDSIQDQLDAKQATITGAASSIVSSDFSNTDAVLISNSSGKVSSLSDVTKTELQTLQGVTRNLATTMTNLGTNVIDSTTNDTPAKWAELGSGYAYFSATGRLVNQPTQYGTVVSNIVGAFVFQFFAVNSSTGSVYVRYGNSSGWRYNWSKLIDDRKFEFDSSTATLNITL